MGTLGLLVKAEAGSRRCPEMPTLAAAVLGPAEGVQRRWYPHPGVTGFFLLLLSPVSPPVKRDGDLQHWGLCSRGRRRP